MPTAVLVALGSRSRRLRMMHMQRADRSTKHARSQPLPVAVLPPPPSAPPAPRVPPCAATAAERDEGWYTAERACSCLQIAPHSACAAPRGAMAARLPRHHANSGIGSQCEIEPLAAGSWVASAARRFARRAGDRTDGWRSHRVPSRRSQRGCASVLPVPLLPQRASCSWSCKLVLAAVFCRLEAGAPRLAPAAPLGSGTPCAWVGATTVGL